MIYKILLFFQYLRYNRRALVIFLLLISTISYRLTKFLYIRKLDIIPFVKFKNIQNNGTLNFKVSTYDINIYLDKVITPIKNVNNDCEMEVFLLYKSEINKIMQNNISIAIKFSNKISQKGEVLLNVYTKLSDLLIEKSVVKVSSNSNWCEILSNHKKII